MSGGGRAVVQRVSFPHAHSCFTQQILLLNSPRFALIQGGHFQILCRWMGLISGRGGGFCRGWDGANTPMTPCNVYVGIENYINEK